MPKTQQLPIDKIGYDPAFYPRVNGREDWMTVYRYSESLTADAKLQLCGPSGDSPPVVVRRHKWDHPYMLIDGLHRMRAYYRAKRDSLPCRVERIPESKWFARSVELNLTHGLVLSAGDKSWIAVKLTHDGWHDDKICGLLKIRSSLLEKFRARAVKIKSAGTGKRERQVNGDRYTFLKPPLDQFAGTATAERVAANQDTMVGRTVIQILDSAIQLLQNGVDMSNEEVRERVDRLAKLVTDAKT